MESLTRNLRMRCMGKGIGFRIDFNLTQPIQGYEQGCIGRRQPSPDWRSIRSARSRTTGAYN
jgi:hypothetical protein